MHDNGEVVTGVFQNDQTFESVHEKLTLSIFYDKFPSHNFVHKLLCFKSYVLNRILFDNKYFSNQTSLMTSKYICFMLSHRPQGKKALIKNN